MRRRKIPFWIPKVPKRPNTSVSDGIKAEIAKYYKGKMRAVFFELGLCRGGRLRADVFALAMNGHTVVVEVKSSVADFRTDKKRDEYLPYANQAYMAMPESVYRKVKDDIDPAEWGVFIMVESATKSGFRIKKVVKARVFDLEPWVVQELAIRAAFRNQDVTNRKNKRA